MRKQTIVVSPKKSRSRFFIEPASLDTAAGKARTDESRLSHQIRNVLRLKSGDAVELLDGLGSLYQANLLEVGRTYIEFSLGNVIHQKAPLFRLTSYQPLIKAHRFEWALEKLTELGVTCIQPFYSERCVVKLKDSEAGRTARWQAICKEASEQCERFYLPELLEPLSLSTLLEKAAADGSANLLLSERSKAPDMVSTLYNLAASAKESGKPLDVAILAGPEGGFTADEQSMISAHGFKAVSLGDSILRSETASILAAGLVSAIAYEPD